MRIAIIGTRGIPASYGGFETFAEELSWRLVERGHEVAVYGRSHYVTRRLREHRGVRVVVLPTLRTKHLDTVVHALLSTLHALRGRFDVALVCNAANSFCCGILALAGRPTVLNVDGVERHRKKWGVAGRMFYGLSERLAVRLASRLVSDARVIRDYYRAQHGKETECIAYGYNVPEGLDPAGLAEFGVEARGYFLYVSRLEPENNAHVVVQAHRQSAVRRPLLVVGDAPYARRYIASLRSIAHAGVRFCGAVYGRRYHLLQAHAQAYIQATEVGGTHPALVEAMGHGNLVLANDTPENREVLGDSGLLYSRNQPAELAGLMSRAEAEPDLREQLGARARRRAGQCYDWEEITTRYETLFHSVLG